MTRRRDRNKILSEADLLKDVGFWFVYFDEAEANSEQLERLRAQGLIGMRRHQRTDGAVVDAYELTDAGLERLRQLTDDATFELKRGHREYFRDQVAKHDIV